MLCVDQEKDGEHEGADSSRPPTILRTLHPAAMLDGGRVVCLQHVPSASAAPAGQRAVDVRGNGGDRGESFGDVGSKGGGQRQGRKRRRFQGRQIYRRRPRRQERQTRQTCGRRVKESQKNAVGYQECRIILSVIKLLYITLVIKKLASKKHKSLYTVPPRVRPVPPAYGVDGRTPPGLAGCR